MARYEPEDGRRKDSGCTFCCGQAARPLICTSLFSLRPAPCPASLPPSLSLRRSFCPSRFIHFCSDRTRGRERRARQAVSFSFFNRPVAVREPSRRMMTVGERCCCTAAGAEVTITKCRNKMAVIYRTYEVPKPTSISALSAREAVSNAVDSTIYLSVTRVIPVLLATAIPLRSRPPRRDWKIRR